MPENTKSNRGKPDQHEIACGDEIRAELLKRLNRIEGQVAGVKRMVESGRECEDILPQIHAARAALEKVFTLMSSFYIVKCLKTRDTIQGNEDNMAATLKRILKF